MEQHSSEPPDGLIYMPFTSAFPGFEPPLADSWLSGCGWASRPQLSSSPCAHRLGRAVSRDLSLADPPRRRVPGAGKFLAGSWQAIVRMYLRFGWCRGGRSRFAV